MHHVPASDVCWLTGTGLCALGVTLFLAVWLIIVARQRFKQWQRRRAATALLLHLSDEDKRLLLEQWPAERMERLFTPAKVLRALGWCVVRVRLEPVHKQAGRPPASIEEVDQLHAWLPRGDMPIAVAEREMMQEADRYQRLGSAGANIYQEHNGHPLWEYDGDDAIY